MLILYTSLSILSLIWIVLSYCGYVRYASLHLHTSESYAKTYLTLPRVPSNNKVIVSLFTRHTNLNDIKLTINSILDQTVHPDQIIISLPPNADIVIPEYIHSNHIIIVHKLAKDYGKSSSFISPLLREKNAETTIIIIDDNYVYGTDFIESMMEASQQNPNSVIYTSGYSLRDFLLNSRLTKEQEDVIETSSGVLIKPMFFDESVLNVDDGPKDIKNYPNILLSMHLHKKGIPIKKLSYSDNIPIIGTHHVNNDSKVASYYASYFPSFN